MRRCDLTSMLLPLCIALPNVALLANETDIEEIQVTATRRPAQASDVSAALSLIDAEAIRFQKLTTDALAGQPGVFLQQTTPGQGAAIVRGLKGSEVLHIVDGFRLNNAIFRNAPTQYLALVSPATVERIEVLRGSPASLYGSDAVGGVLQVINRLPAFDDDAIASSAYLSAGADTAELQRSLSATLEIGNRTLAGLISLDYLSTGNRRVGGGARIGPSGFSSGSGRAALAYTPDSSSSWILDLQYGRQPETPRIDELVPGFGEIEPASAEFFFAPNERTFAHLRHLRTDGWWSLDWSVAAGWQRIVDDRRSRNLGSGVRRLEDNASDLFGLVATVSSGRAALSWIAGAEIYHDTVSSRRVEVDVPTGTVAPVRSRFPDGSDVLQASIFGQLSVDVGTRQTVSGGLRASLVQVGLAETPFSQRVQNDIEDISADLGWSYDLTAGLQLVANAGFGFRAPNVFDLGTLGERPGNRFNIPNPSLGSEDITQLDAGIRYRNSIATAEIVVWSLDYSDRIASVLTGTQTVGGRDIVQTQNRASAELWGVEANGRFLLSDRVSVDGVVNYTRGEQTGADRTVEPGDRVPPLNGRLTLRMRWSDALDVDAFVTFAGRQDRLSERDVGDSRIDPEGTDGWTTANVTAIWRPDEHWLLRVGAHNIFDERYRVHGSGLDAPGRNFSVDVRYAW